jgi:hypothetical protein
MTMDAINPKADAPLRKRGRPFGSKSRAVFRRPGTKRDLVPLEETSGSARFMRRCVRDIEADLGGRRHLSRIEGELIRALAGAATLLQYQNVQIALGESTELDPAAYASLASTILRIGSRLGLARRPKEIIPTLDAYLDLKREVAAKAVVAADEAEEPEEAQQCE